jgi:hypothetical protein
MLFYEDKYESLKCQQSTYDNLSFHSVQLMNILSTMETCEAEYWHQFYFLSKWMIEGFCILGNNDIQSTETQPVFQRNTDWHSMDYMMLDPRR